MESDLLTHNPFAGLQRPIKPKRHGEKAWAAFTIQERDRIIQTFEVREPFYAPWVKFLFWTGCRPEEAAALKWEHVSMDCQEVLIIEAFPVDMKQAQSTKNYQTTRFPCNARLQRLLRSTRSDDWSRQDFVFQGVKGGHFDMLLLNKRRFILMASQ